MNDRALAELTARTGGRALGVACTFALMLGSTRSAAAAETPPEVNPVAPAPAAPSAVPAPANTAPPAPANATAPAPAAAPATPAHDDDDDDDASDAEAKPSPPAHDAAAVPMAPTLVTPPHPVAETPAPRPQPTIDHPDLNSIDDGTLGTHQQHWLLGIGLRETFVTSKGYDPFSTDNVLPQFSLNLGRAFYASGPLSFAGMLVWDYGSTKASARGTDASLRVHRLTVGAEARYHLLRRLYVFGRVAPGALRSDATLHDQVVGVDRTAGAWVFASDFSAGSAFEFAGDARGASTHPRGFIGVDGGYSWASASKLDLDAKSSASTPARLESWNFGDLALRGAFLRLTATVTY